MESAVIKWNQQEKYKVPPKPVEDKKKHKKHRKRGGDSGKNKDKASSWKLMKRENARRGPEFKF